MTNLRRTLLTAALLPLAGAAPVSAEARAVLPHACARTAPITIPANAWAPTKVTLAPAGASAIRLCRYTGVPHPTLARGVLHTGRGLVARLVRDFDRLPPAPAGPTACPSDRGDEIIGLLAYPNGHAVTIKVGLGGCATVTNGNLFATALGFGNPPGYGPGLARQLGQLTGFHGVIN